MDLQTLRGFFAQSPFMRDLGVEVDACEPGRVRTSLPVQPRFLQHSGVVHAGVMVTLADHSMGSSAQTLADAGRWMLTVELKSSQLRPAVGERLECEAWVLKPGRNLFFTEAEVYARRGDQRSLVMKASATMMAVERA